MRKATDVNEIIGTMTGARGIKFDFVMKDGSRKGVTFDFYGNGAQFNGAEYKRIESAALGAMMRAGFTEIDTFSHFIFG